MGCTVPGWTASGTLPSSEMPSTRLPVAKTISPSTAGLPASNGAWTDSSGWTSARCALLSAASDCTVIGASLSGGRAATAQTPK